MQGAAEHDCEWLSICCKPGSRDPADLCSQVREVSALSVSGRLAYTWQAGPSAAPVLKPVPVSAAPHKGKCLMMWFICVAPNLRTPRTASTSHGCCSVPRKALGARRAYARVETEPGLDQFVNDAEGNFTVAAQRCYACCLKTCVHLQ